MQPEHEPHRRKATPMTERKKSTTRKGERPMKRSVVRDDAPVPALATSHARQHPAPDLGPLHDPGFAGARERAEQMGADRAPIVNLPSGGQIRVGTAGWTDPTLTAPGVFYPKGMTSAEARLKYYASLFPLVEVDSTYYALPARRMAELWAERTPDDFTFNLKAHALMTGQPTEVSRLPTEIRDALPDELAEKRRIYGKDLPPELYDEVWRSFADAIEPLRSSGKLGAVLLQYPRWFMPNRANTDAILEARERLGDIPVAVEFRNQLWLDGRHGERTLGFLEEHDLPFVMVDEPQGTAASVPPIAAATSPQLAMLRMHGRRKDLWTKPNATVTERFRYLYDAKELEQWVPKVEDIARTVAETHVIFNNCYGNYGTTNALEMGKLLQDTAHG